MQHIFYFFAIIAIIYEFQVFFNTKRYLDFKMAIKGKERSEYEIEETVFVFFQILYTIWGVAGIMSSQWILFLTYFLLSITPKLNKAYLIKIDALLSLLILAFIVINKYHLRIDFKELILSWF